ncbi:uncharacterized protein SPSK_04377 [Sporothrix schenckii 1099-18]|uniref:Uncharacterized protein n=2 Tax=Sporothrix schenckii TaxID=29908 RepID=U7PTX0_SPOS1|nr:uncharacterized protein SPSK_04377 [Sporothrix schenckii 1099-18]ERS99078.1 hypothetical protein HMPREF1624_04273 [Sporothrix schenckii ATCC 58251]KJR83267.1 hypothetical protein SPSK_04377 [Sporothrix schenckii 1099-18]
MPPQLLPASAAAFAPRASSVNVVLGSKVEPWLTQNLKRINRVKRPLNSVAQHQRCLTETLSSENAIWTLTSLMVPKAPEAELRQDPNPLVEALFNYQLITVEAYIVHVDMVLRNEVAFKLTPDSIEALIEYHKDIHTVDNKANTFDWPEKEQQAKKMHNDFVQAINKYVYRTHVTALEGLEEDGAGELLCGKSDEVKTNIMGLFKTLTPPPPKPVEVFRQPPLLPSNAGSANLSSLWTQPSLSPHPANAMAAAIAATAAAITSTLPAPVEAWRVLPSSPNISATSVESTNTIWANMSMQEMQHDMPHDMQQQHQHQHQQHMSPSPPLHYSQAYSTAPLYYASPLVTEPMPQLTLPSMLTPQQCGVSVGYGGFGWDRYQEYTAAMI